MSEHPYIWLQPWCDGCEKIGPAEGRLWCQDDPWGECEECGRKSVRYRLDKRRQAPPSHGDEATGASEG